MIRFEFSKQKPTKGLIRLDQLLVQSYYPLGRPLLLLLATVVGDRLQRCDGVARSVVTQYKSIPVVHVHTFVERDIHDFFNVVVVDLNLSKLLRNGLVVANRTPVHPPFVLINR